MTELAYTHPNLGAPIADADHAANHPWCLEVQDLLSAAGTPLSVVDRVLSEIGHVLHNDAPQPITLTQLLCLGAKVELGDTHYSATAHVPRIGTTVVGEGSTAEEAVLDAYARKRQVDGHPIIERVGKMLQAADVSWRVIDQVSAVLKRIRLRYTVMTSGSVPVRQAVSPSPCPCCARGRLLPVRYTENILLDGFQVRVINLEGDYCSGCGETTVSPAAARRNEHRIGSAASEARKRRLGLR